MELIRKFEYETWANVPEKIHGALESFYGEKGVPYYDLVRGGVRFKNYVGVIQVGNTTIEVLPKIDKQTESDETWQNVLITMLRQSGMLKTEAPTSASLRLKSNSILDLYMELFLNECDYLLNRGLIKRYRKTEGNRTALKGSLMFNQHVSKNLVHKERFYVRHTVYDAQHQLNQILLKTIRLIHGISNASSLRSKVGSLLLRFPELPDIKVSDSLFNRLNHDRKSEHYKKAIDIARLLLLNYHPDISSGRNNVLALMFDMNDLWERWVLRRLQQKAPRGWDVSGQERDEFWIPEKGRGSKKNIIPDIVITKPDKTKIVVDTKWKLPQDLRPSDADLKQMFSYNRRFNSRHSILLYPGQHKDYKGSFFDSKYDTRKNGLCEVKFLDVVNAGILTDDNLEQLFKLELSSDQ